MNKKILFHCSRSFYNIFLLIAFLMLTLISSSCDSNEPAETDNNQLEYVTPEDVGYSSAQLENAKQFAEQSGYAAVMALYDGKVFFSWGNITYNYLCHSIQNYLRIYLQIFHFL